MSNLGPHSVFRPSHRSRMKCRCPCKSPARQIDGAACPSAGQVWRMTTLHGCINHPLQTCRWCPPPSRPLGRLGGSSGHHQDRGTSWWLWVGCVSSWDASYAKDWCSLPHPNGHVPTAPSQWQWSNHPVQLPHPNSHVQTATSQRPCSNHPALTAAFKLPSRTATSQCPCSNCPVQMPQLPYSDHYLQTIPSRQPRTNCHCSLPYPNPSVPTGGPACLASEVPISQGMDTSSRYTWDEHDPPTSWPPG